MENKMLKKLMIFGLATSLGCAKTSFSPVQIENQIASVPTPSSTPTAVPVPVPTPAPTTNKIMNLTKVVDYGNKQVDFLIVFDDSNSMMPHLQKLAAGLGTFVNSLETSNIDWQMCMTTTRYLTLGGKQLWGQSFKWLGYNPPAGTPSTLLKKGTANLENIFINTVSALKIGLPGSGDERAIRAAYQHFLEGAPNATNSNGCYRKDAAVSVIMVSNEDERSVGGDKTKIKPTDAAGSFQILEAGDLPANLLATAKNSFGSDVRFTFNSIIVKPGDLNCEYTQDHSCTSPSHPGVTYEKMSKLTDGGIGSICDANFASNLNTFKDKIVNSLSNMTLPCQPKIDSLKVSVNDHEFSGFALDSDLLKFNSPLTEGTKINLTFDCK